jgi:hypothetical protein
MSNIEHAVMIAATPETIYPLTSTGGGFARWWAADVTEQDGVTALGFFNRATIYRLRLVTASPPTVCDWVIESGDEWNSTHLVFQVAGSATGSRLRFTHAGWAGESDYFVNCTTTWGELMYRLKAAAEGKPRGPLFLANSLAY